MLCSNSGGKRLHNVVRSRVFVFADTWLSSSQCGGRPKVGIDFASHSVKRFIDLLHARRLSGMLFFIDIRSAFYSAVRPLFFATGGCDEEIARLVASLGVAPEIVADFIVKLRQMSALEQAGSPQHLESLVAGMFEGAWWQMRGFPEPSNPQIGFSPGTGLADLAFSMVFRLFLCSMQSQIIRAGLAFTIRVEHDPVFPCISRGTLIDCIDTTWVDDTVIMSVVRSAALVHGASKQLGSIVLTELRRFGFNPNTKKGKTQILPVLHGRDLKIAEDEIWTQNQGVCNVSWPGGVDVIHYGRVYKHLGSYKDVKRSKATEIGYRAAEAGSASRELFKALRKTNVDPPRQWRFVSSLCNSRLLLDIQTETSIARGSIGKLKAAYDGFARRCCGKRFFDPKSRVASDIALAHCNALPLEDHIRLARLTYLGRLVAHGPPFLIALLELLSCTKHSYVHTIFLDLQYVFDGRGACFGLPDPRVSLADSLSFIAADVKRWKKLIARIRAAATSSFSLTTLGVDFEARISRLCDLHAVPRIHGEIDLVVPHVPQYDFVCWCSYRASSLSALVTHSANMHGHRLTAYHYLNSHGDCLSCLKCYHSKARLLSHLTRSKDKLCLNRLIANYPPDFVPAARAKFGKASKGDAVNRHRGTCPVSEEDRMPIFSRAGRSFRLKVEKGSRTACLPVPHRSHTLLKTKLLHQFSLLILLRLGRCDLARGLGFC